MTDLKLQMDPGEILTDYRLAENKMKQISILAELNVCTKTQIARFLAERGEPLPAFFAKQLGLPEDSPKLKRGGNRPPTGSQKAPSETDAAKKDRKPKPEPSEPNPVPEPAEEPKDPKPRVSEARKPYTPPVMETMSRREFRELLEGALPASKAAGYPARGPQCWTLQDIKAKAFDVIADLLQKNSDEEAVIAARPVAWAAMGLRLLIAALEESGK